MSGIEVSVGPDMEVSQTRSDEDISIKLFRTFLTLRNTLPSCTIESQMKSAPMWMDSATTRNVREKRTLIETFTRVVESGWPRAGHRSSKSMCIHQVACSGIRSISSNVVVFHNGVEASEVCRTWNEGASDRYELSRLTQSFSNLSAFLYANASISASLNTPLCANFSTNAHPSVFVLNG